MTKYHVPYEWREFVEKHYKRSATICGTKSVNVAIPGITENVDEWCPLCAHLAIGTIQNLDSQGDISNEHVRALYQEAYIVLFPVAEARAKSMAEARQRVLDARARR